MTPDDFDQFVEQPETNLPMPCPRQEDIDDGCPGEFREESPCSIDVCPPKCEFGPWCEWSDCTATCGGGKVARTRTCDCPEGIPESECENDGQCEERVGTSFLKTFAFLSKLFNFSKNL